jgi:hypothetical protein
MGPLCSVHAMHSGCLLRLCAAHCVLSMNHFPKLCHSVVEYALGHDCVVPSSLDLVPKFPTLPLPKQCWHFVLLPVTPHAQYVVSEMVR